MFDFLRRHKTADTKQLPASAAADPLPPNEDTLPHDDVFLIVWRAAYYGDNPAAPDVIAAEMGLLWAKEDAKRWKRHCRPCGNCGAWMYDPLHDFCPGCADY